LSTWYRPPTFHPI
jgi:hypothetical protein